MLNISDLPNYYLCKKFELKVDRDRLWINNGTGLIARFSSRGVDIHRDGLCVSCNTKELKTFNYFVAELNRIHGIDLNSLKNKT